MLTKILFTIAVIVVILLIFHGRFRKSVRQVPQRVSSSSSKGSKFAIYSVVVVLTLAGAGVFVYNWWLENTVITIRVISPTNEVVSYRAYRKDISGRSFKTLDGKSVTLGDSDRVEHLEH